MRVPKNWSPKYKSMYAQGFVVVTAALIVSAKSGNNTNMYQEETG